MMKNIDVESIKSRTSNKIGYYNFKEENSRKCRIRKHIYSVLCMILLLAIGTYTVNATTNNGVINLINRIIKVNGKETTAEVYEVPSEKIYSKCKGEYVVTDASKCIKYYLDKDYNENGDTICYPLDAEFEDIEIFYDENNHFAGFHITGTSNGEHFDDYLKDSN